MARPFIVKATHHIDERLGEDILGVGSGREGEGVHVTSPVEVLVWPRCFRHRCKASWISASLHMSVLTLGMPPAVEHFLARPRGLASRGDDVGLASASLPLSACFHDAPCLPGFGQRSG
jgi:hypothetical protein